MDVDDEDVASVERFVKTKQMDANGIENGLKFFQLKVVKQSKKLAQSDQNFHKAAQLNANVDEEFLLNLKSTLFQKIMECMKLYNVDKFVNLENVHDNIVSVNVEGTQIYGTVDCIICLNEPNKKNIRPKRVSYYSGDDSKHWIPSNFITHLKTVHKILPPSTNKKNKTVKKVSTISTIDPKVSHKNTMLLNQDEIVMLDESVYMSNDIEKDTAKSNCSEDVWYHQISDQITKMTAAVLTHNETQCEINVMLSTTDESEVARIKVIQSPGDGNCLFTSLAHQLTGFKMNSRELKYDSNKLRADVVEHIKKNYSSFENEIKGRVYDNIDDQKRFNMLSGPIDLEKECTFFLNTLLPTKKYWGGSETLKAVSQMYSVNIIVFRENGPYQIVNQFNETFNQTLNVAYRFGVDTFGNVERNHYDSVSDISPSDVCILAEKLNKGQ